MMKSVIRTCKSVATLCLLSFAGHTALAVAMWYAIGVGDTPASRAMNETVPPIVWPFLIALTGIIALIGIQYRIAARISLWYGAAIMLTWSVISFMYWNESRQPQPGAIFLLYLAALKVVVAELMIREEVLIKDKIITNEEVKVLTEEARALTEEVRQSTTMANQR